MKEIPKPKYSIGQVFTPISENGAPVEGLTGDYPIVEVGDFRNGHYYYRLDTGDPSVSGWTRDDLLLTRKELDRLVGGDPFTHFLALHHITPNGSKFYKLLDPCPICGTGTLTVWAGNKGNINVQCSNRCHSKDMGRGMNLILDRLEKQQPPPGFQIAVNRNYTGKIPQSATKSVWYQFNHSFKTETLDLEGLIAVIRAGYAITAVHNNERKKDNFVSAQHIGLDFDTEDEQSSLDVLQADPFIAGYGALIHTSASHTPEKPRARVLFILDKPITDADCYARYAEALVARFHVADKHCTDPVRIWFGSKDCEYRLLGNVLPAEVLEKEVANRPAQPKQTHSTPKLDKTIPQGKRNGTLTSLGGSLRRKGLSVPEIEAALKGVNAQRCDPPLPDIEVERIAQSVGRYDADPLETTSTTPDPEKLFEDVMNTNANDRHAALRKLAQCLSELDPFTVGMYAERVKAARLYNKTEFIQAVKDAQKSGSVANTAGGRKDSPTDDELGERWIQSYPLTAYGLGEFRRYQDGAWPGISQDIVKAEISKVIEDAKKEGVRPTRGRLESVLELVRLKISAPNELWDADSDLLPCKNGVLHIPSRTLHEHDPKYHFTTRLDYDYDPDADASNFKQALYSSIPDAAEMVQEFFGYTLTTDTRYESAIWFFGPPGSGKSTILLGLQVMLGPRAGLLGLNDIVHSRFALTNLIGKTLVFSTEQPQSFISATHIINAIISGEPIEIDRKFKEPMIITPYAKIAWAMNELPRIDGASNGIYRRLMLVRFSPRAKEEQDIDLKEKIKKEGPGILNWSLDGLARLRERGNFSVPSSVVTATEQFQESNDIPRIFLQEVCLTDPNYKTQSNDLYQAYRQWCEKNGHRAQSSTTIAEDWERLGLVRTSINGRRYWKGVQVKRISLDDL